MNHREIPITFTCRNETLIGIISKPESPKATGVVIVVGGPQYRAGSHRQFTLLARALAKSGYTTLRFDYRGMGDSEGESRTFENIDEDIRTAIDTLMALTPELQQIVLWGLCDAASANLIYAHKDSRIQGLFLANPWVHSSSSEQAVRIKYYYLKKLLDREFWRKVMTGKINIYKSVSEFINSVLCLFGSKMTALSPNSRNNANNTLTFIDKMADGIEQFGGKIRIVLSEQDLVAQEFKQLIASDHRWNALHKNLNVEIITIPKANHTFSCREKRIHIETLTVDFMGTTV